MNENSGRRNQRQHSGNNQNGGRGERNQGRMRSGFKGGRAGGRAGGRGRSTSRNPSRRTAEQPNIYGNGGEASEARPSFAIGNPSHCERGSGRGSKCIGYAYDRATTQSRLSKNPTGNVSGTRSLENAMCSMNYDDVFNDCSAPITEMTGVLYPRNPPGGGENFTSNAFDGYTCTSTSEDLLKMMSAVTVNKSEEYNTSRSISDTNSANALCLSERFTRYLNDDESNGVRREVPRPKGVRAKIRKEYSDT